MFGFASLSYVKRKEPQSISIQFEWRPTGQFFWLNSSDCFQNNLFLSNSCASGQLRSDEVTVSLDANYWTNFLPIFTMCPVTLLMNILDICMNNQTAHRRADCLFVRLEMLWRWYCNSVCPCESNTDRRKGSSSGLSLSIHRCPEIGCQIFLVGKSMRLCFWQSPSAFIRLSGRTVVSQRGGLIG